MEGLLNTTTICDILCEIVIFVKVNEILTTKEKDKERCKYLKFILIKITMNKTKLIIL